MKNSKGIMVRRTKRFKKTRKLTVGDRVKTFKKGDRVVISLQPCFSGFPAPRYDGRHGTIVEKRGKAYVVEIRDMDAKKRLIASPVHLKGMQ